VIRISAFNFTSYIGAFMGPMCLLAVLAFHYPEYLTTPRLRSVYTETQMRTLLFAAMWIAFCLGTAGLVLSARKRLAAAGTLCLVVAWLVGGSQVGFESPVETGRFYLSLDWVLLDLTMIALVFVSLERAFGLKPEQRVLRRGLKTDLTHYVVNHLFNGGVVYVITLPAMTLKETFGFSGQGGAALPLLLQVVLIMAVTDFTQYWVHRAFHRIPLLWRFHRIHHSVRVMDWVAGSRLHIIDIVATRAISLTPMVLLGFSNEAVNVYLPILALQSVFVHGSIGWNLGAIRKITTTPQFHHWHHTAQREHLDRNFSISLPLFDLLFRTYYCPEGEWPRSYGLDELAEESPVEEGYLVHLVSPFVRD